MTIEVDINMSLFFLLFGTDFANFVNFFIIFSGENVEGVGGRGGREEVRKGLSGPSLDDGPQAALI